ncbi:MAG: carboxypeptidase regulatory-like domain-containing protein [Kofleriaceae bacterium]
MPRARLALLVVLVGTQTLNAAPQVEIKGKSQLSLTKVKTRDDGVEVTGQLVDKLTSEGLPGQNVTVSIGAATESALTQPDGTFRIVIQAEPGPVKVELGYTGTRVVDRADPLTVTTDPSKQQIELGIVKVTDEPQGARLRLSALGDDVTGAGGSIDGLRVEREVAPQSTDAFHHVLNAKSGTEVSLARKDAGGPGMYRLRAIYRGDDRDQAATKEVLIELASATATTMTLSATKIAYEDNLVARGSVMDDYNRPVPNATVTLTTGDRRLAQGATADNGTYRFSVEASVLGQGSFGLQVQADPGRSYVKPSRAEPQIVRVSAPAPVPVSYTVAAFAATALAAAAFFLARRKPWLRLRKAAPPAEAPGDEVAIDVANGGLVVAKPGIVSTLRRAHDDGFSGVVRDTVRGRPIADATVHLVYDAAELELTTGADGTFAFEHLGVGEWRAHVSAAGHVTEKFSVTVPHRGELRGVRIDLVPVRERVFQLYRRAAEPVLPEPRLWGIWSPRQIVDHVRTKRPTPALAELTDFVEEVYFSPRVAVEDALVQANERVDRAIQERAGRAR